LEYFASLATTRHITIWHNNSCTNTIGIAWSNSVIPSQHAKVNFAKHENVAFCCVSIAIEWLARDCWRDIREVNIYFQLENKTETFLEGNHFSFNLYLTLNQASVVVCAI
jgi:hypothetical protein